MHPAQVEEKPPAVRPYSRLKIQSSGSEVAKPQRRNTESVAPMVAKPMTEVTCKRSVRLPIMTVPKTDIVLKSANVTVPPTEDSPMARA